MNDTVHINKLKKFQESGLTPTQIVKAANVSKSLFYQVVNKTYSNKGKAKEIYDAVSKWLLGLQSI